MTEDVLCKDNAWDKAGGLRVFQCLIAAIAGHATDTEFVGALAVDQRIFARVGQGKIEVADVAEVVVERDRKSTRLNSSHQIISYAVFCLKKKKKKEILIYMRPYIYHATLC